MNKTEFKKTVELIVGDISKTIEERLEGALVLCPAEDDKDAGEKNMIVYSALLDMLWQECNDHSRDRTMLQLYVLLAEAYDDADNYRPMGDLANGVLRLMRDRMTSSDIYKETIPRLASAIGNSVYNHALFEILLMYVKSVLKDNPDDQSIKPHVKKLVKLYLLLDYNEWYEQEWNKDFQKALSRFFSSEELMYIISNPRIGHLNRDPVEYTWEWERIYYDMEAELDARFQNAPRQMGLCFRIWSVKRDLLKEKYGIEWRSPAQMNPRVLFD
ncbi:MAG: hypothetical protein K2G91_11255 [Prevotella sp.]|nr:hypothetical protein [Prevotella sp.]